MQLKIEKYMMVHVASMGASAEVNPLSVSCSHTATGSFLLC